MSLLTFPELLSDNLINNYGKNNVNIMASPGWKTKAELWLLSDENEASEN
jgi:hypothetical protein